MRVLTLLTLAVLVVGKAAPSSDDEVSPNRSCEGCRAAVVSAAGILEGTGRTEASVGEVLTNIEKLCDAERFKDSAHHWQFAPSEVSTACKAFMAAEKTSKSLGAVDAIAWALTANSGADSVNDCVQKACHTLARVCTEGECSPGTKKESAKKKAKKKSDPELDAEFRAAAASGKWEDMDEALRDGADIDSVDKQSGQSALMAACLRGNHEAVTFLLKQGADWKVGEKDGYTCLHGAGFQGRPQVAEAALAAGLPVSEPHGDGFLPIHRAAWGMTQGHAETIKVFVEKGGENVDAVSTSGTTPLMNVAAGRGTVNHHSIKVLVQLGADLNRQDKNGKTALLSVMEGGKNDASREKAAKALIKGGADVTVKDKSGKTVAEHAKRLGYDHLLK